MTSGVDTRWVGYARRLADRLCEAGDIRSLRWHAAVSAVPRHVLVPRAYQPDDAGGWSEFETAGALERVYSPETLVTALESVGGHRLPVSSSTKPDLMARMLEILAVREGHRVLEIGTGTGYNAALLAHRLGDEHIFSVDVDSVLVESARERLAAAGFRPTLVAGDGAHGLPEHAPFDRIMATCSVPAVPWAWAEQLAPGATILLDLKPAVSAGNLVHLRRVEDRLEGRFTARWAAFMAMRSGAVSAPVEPMARALGGRTRSTTAPAAPWRDAPVVWFLAQLRLPPGTSFGYDLDPGTRQPVATTVAAPDGSWARTSLTDATVAEAGDTPLWSSVEWAHHEWTALGYPNWDRWGLTVTPDGIHRIWLDHPERGHQWRMPPVDR